MADWKSECSLFDLANVVPTLAKFYHQASEAYEQACTRHINMIIYYVSAIHPSCIFESAFWLFRILICACFSVHSLFPSDIINMIIYIYFLFQDCF